VVSTCDPPWLAAAGVGARVNGAVFKWLVSDDVAGLRGAYLAMRRLLPFALCPPFSTHSLSFVITGRLLPSSSPAISRPPSALSLLSFVSHHLLSVVVRNSLSVRLLTLCIRRVVLGNYWHPPSTLRAVACSGRGGCWGRPLVVVLDGWGCVTVDRGVVVELLGGQRRCGRRM
jgi:hypothetical protein